MRFYQAEGAVLELGSESHISHFIREEKVALPLHRNLIATYMNRICCTLRAKPCPPRLWCLLLGNCRVSWASQSCHRLDRIISKDLDSHDYICGHGLNDLGKIGLISVVLVEDSNQLFIEANH